MSRDTAIPGVGPGCPWAEPAFPAFPPLLSQPVARSLLDAAACTDISETRERYLLRLHGVNYGSLPGVLVDEQVHVVVSEGWQDFHLHVGLAHCPGLPQLVLRVQEFSSQLCWTWAPKNRQSSALAGGQVGQGMAGAPAHRRTAQPSSFRREEQAHHGTKPCAPQGSGCSTAAPRRRGNFAFHAGKALYLDQRGDFKGQESRMELAKGLPGTVTLQKKSTKGTLQQKNEKEGGKKKKEKCRNTHTAPTEISESLFGEMSSCTARGEKPGSPGEDSLPGQVRGTHRAPDHACPDATPLLPCLLLVQCLIRSKKQIPDANNPGLTARCTGTQLLKK